MRASPVNAIQMNSAKISSVLRVEYFMSLVALLREYIITYTAFHKPTLKLYQIKVKHLLYLLVSAFKYLINFTFRSKWWNYLKQVFRFKVWIGLNHFNCNENLTWSILPHQIYFVLSTISSPFGSCSNSVRHSWNLLNLI